MIGADGPTATTGPTAERWRAPSLPLGVPAKASPTWNIYTASADLQAGISARRTRPQRHHAMTFPEPPARGRHRASPFQGRRQRFLSRGQLGGVARRRGAVRPGTETRHEPAEGPTFRPLREITFDPADLVAPGQAGARECRSFSAPQTPSTGVGGRRASHRLAPWWRIRKEGRKLRATGTATHLLQALAQGRASQATQVEICSEVAPVGLSRGRPREISQPLRPHLRAQGSDMSRKRLKPDTTVSDATAKPEEAEALCQGYK